MTVPLGVVSRPRRFTWSFWSLVSAGALLFLLLFLVLPLGRLLGASLFSGSGDRIWSAYAALFTKAYYLEALGNSIVLTVVATVIATGLGTALAYLLSRYRLRGKLLVRALIVLTFVSPPFIGAYSWILLFGRSGFVTKSLHDLGITLPSIYGWPGTIIVLSLQATPLVYLMVSSGFRTIDQSVEDAAVNLGASHWRTLWTTTLPLMRPAISTGAMLAAVTAFTDIGTPAIIGQNLRVLPRLIYQEFVSETGTDYQVASALSVVLLLFTIGALLLQRWYSRRHSYGHSCNTPLAIRQSTPVHRAIVHVIVYGIVLVIALPILTVVVSSVLKTQGSTFLLEFSLDGWRKTPRLWTALGNTMFLATVSTVLCVAIGTLIAYVTTRRRSRVSDAIDFLSMVPYAVAGIVLAIAMSVTFGGAPFYLAGTFTILILVYVVRRLPFSVRSSAAMLAQTGSSAEEASVNLGVPPWKTFFRITVPMILPAILSGGLLTWATLVREFNATVILYGSQTGTMAVEIFRQVLRGDFASASVVGTLLLLVSAVPIIILFKFLGKDEEFLS